jgi:primosomal protein DnaI
MKGMYLTGQYQQGKTYTLAALANELTKKGCRVIIAYYPDLVREIKSSIGNHTLEALIAKLKKADILMLDDIGGENQSSWIRDEVLGPILQHRLLDELPTFFSSNVSRKELPMYMVENQQKAEMMKAYRIHARVETLTEEFKM